VNSSKNPKYSKLTQQINLVGEQIEKIKASRANYNQLTKSLKELVEKYDVQYPIPNLIDLEIQKTVQNIKNTLRNKFDEEKISQTLNDLNKEQLSLSAELEDYLKNQGLSQENINDYERAVKAIPQHRTIIDTLNIELKEIELATKEFNFSKNIFFEGREKLEKLIEENIIPLNQQLKSSNVNVKDISFKYEFDYEKAKSSVFRDFWNYFENKRPTTFNLNTTVDAVERYLFTNDPFEVLTRTRADFIQKYNSTNPAQAEQYILKLFDVEAHYEIYQLAILRNLINPISFKWIAGFYDSKELRNCSFGQRCTAVIVALLSFGNKPLIIDEPEAHLDSKLIAEYLVNLVKKRKEERQIIFATHNANFVVNGDAELILHLEVNNSNETIITPISIENTEHRKKLLLLEGGEEAFKKRDKRLMKN
jgi:predicted ATPase